MEVDAEESKVSTIGENVTQSLKRYQCKHCKKRYCYLGSVEKHELRCRLSTRNVKTNCFVCGTTFSGDVVANNHVIRSHTKNGYFFCFLCGMEFIKYASLLWHFDDTHAPSELIKCCVCSKVFPSFDTLQIHCCANMGGNPLSCRLCNIQWEDVKAFITNHPCVMVDDQMKCPCCTFSSKSTSDFSVHLSRHTGKRIYECDVCSSKHRSAASLKFHREKHFVEEDKHITCQICGKKFLNDADIVRHGISTHGEKKFKCKECPKAFARKIYLSHHISGCHVKRRCHAASSLPYESVRGRNMSQPSVHSSSSKGIGSDTNTTHDASLKVSVSRKELQTVSFENNIEDSDNIEDLDNDVDMGQNIGFCNNSDVDESLSLCTGTEVNEDTDALSEIGLDKDSDGEKSTATYDEMSQVTNNKWTPDMNSAAGATVSDRLTDIQTSLVTGNTTCNKISGAKLFHRLLGVSHDSLSQMNPVVSLVDLSTVDELRDMKITSEYCITENELLEMKEKISKLEASYMHVHNEVGISEPINENDTIPSSTELSPREQTTSDDQDQGQDTLSTPPKEPQHNRPSTESPQDAMVSRDTWRKIMLKKLPIFCQYGDEESSDEETAAVDEPDNVTCEKTIATDSTPNTLCQVDCETNCELDGRNITQTNVPANVEGHVLDPTGPEMSVFGITHPDQLKTVDCATLFTSESGDDIAQSPLLDSSNITIQHDAKTTSLSEPSSEEDEIGGENTDRLTEPRGDENGDTVLQCGSCELTFVSKYNLAKHLRLHNNDILWTCQYCGKQLHSSSLLAEHKLAHHSEQDTTCREATRGSDESAGSRLTKKDDFQQSSNSSFSSNFRAPKASDQSSNVVDRQTAGEEELSDSGESNDFSSEVLRPEECNGIDVESEHSFIDSELTGGLSLDGEDFAVKASTPFSRRRKPERVKPECTVRMITLEEPLIPPSAFQTLTQSKDANIFNLSVMLDFKSYGVAASTISCLQTSDGTSGLFVPLDYVRGIELKARQETEVGTEGELLLRTSFPTNAEDVCKETETETEKVVVEQSDLQDISSTCDTDSLNGDRFSLASFIQQLEVARQCEV